MIVSTLAAMADPLKIMMSLFLILSIHSRSKSRVVANLLALGIYLIVGYQSSISRDVWFAVNVLSILSLSVVWSVLLLMIGRWAAGAIASAAALGAVALVAFSVAAPKATGCFRSTCSPQSGALHVTEDGSRAKASATTSMSIEQGTASDDRDAMGGAKSPFIDLHVAPDPREPVRASTGISVVGASEEDRTEWLAWSVANSYRDASFVPLVGSAIDLARALRRSFVHGDNIAVNVLQDLQRAAISGVSDDQWNEERRAKFADHNAKSIPANQRWRYMATRNELEARLLLADTEADAAALKVNAYFGGL